MEHRIVFQRRPQVTAQDVIQALKSRRAEQRADVLRLEIDYELAVLFETIQQGRGSEAEACKERLREMRIEMLRLEM